MDLGMPLAVGRTAEIFLWKKTQVLKLFRDDWSLDSINYEYKISKLVENAGLQVPKVFDLLEVNGRQGIIYEKIIGRSMLESLTSKPLKVKSFGHQLANLHESLHNEVIST